MGFFDVVLGTGVRVGFTVFRFGVSQDVSGSGSS